MTDNICGNFFCHVLLRSCRQKTIRDWKWTSIWQCEDHVGRYYDRSILVYLSLVWMRVPWAVDGIVPDHTKGYHLSSLHRNQLEFKLGIRYIWLTPSLAGKISKYFISATTHFVAVIIDPIPRRRFLRDELQCLCNNQSDSNITHWTMVARLACAVQLFTVPTLILLCRKEIIW